MIEKWAARQRPGCIADNLLGGTYMSETKSSPSPLRLSLVSGRYRSLVAPLTWECQPRIAVLTGENGAGKTQLLELLYGHHHTNVPSFREKMKDRIVEITPKYKQHEVIMISDLGRVSGNF